MKRKFTTLLSLGLVAGFLGISLAQSAEADTFVMYGSSTLAPSTVLVESPTVERVITSPVMIESPATVERVIHAPVLIEKKERRHLLNLGLFGVDVSVL